MPDIFSGNDHIIRFLNGLNSGDHRIIHQLQKDTIRYQNISQITVVINHNKIIFKRYTIGICLYLRILQRIYKVRIMIQSVLSMIEALPLLHCTVNIDS